MFYRNKSSFNLLRKKNNKLLFKASNNLILKKPLLTKENNKHSVNPSHNYNFHTNKTNNESQISTSFCHEIKDIKDKSGFNSSKNKYKKIVLPSLPNTNNFHPNMFPTLILDSKNNNNNESKEKEPSPHKKIKLKKIKIKKNGKYSPNIKKDKYLVKLYEENYENKKKLVKFREKYNNLSSFSLSKYNFNLIRLSSIDLSHDSYTKFKKNMRDIDNRMKGINLRKRNRWANLLDKIETMAPEGLKKKLINLSLSKDKVYKKKI
jgi:hypothetical protein